MKPKRGDRAAPPAQPGFWEIRFATSDAAKGWEELAQQAKSDLWTAWETLRTAPCPYPHTGRHHPLKGSLSHLWQYEVTRAARIWYFVDESKKIVWLQQAGTAHPAATDNKNRR